MPWCTGRRSILAARRWTGQRPFAYRTSRSRVDEMVAHHIPGKLFDERERSDSGPMRFSESTFQFVNRVDRPAWGHVRSVLNQWFHHYPDDSKTELHSRFTKSDEGQHIGAWWELYVYTLHRLLGYRTVVHPKIEGTKRKPDFLVTRGTTSRYVECTATSSFDAMKNRTPGTREWIYDCISDIQPREFLVGIETVKEGTQRPKRSEITRPIVEWLATLNPDHILASSPETSEGLPRQQFPIRDWQVTCVAYPNRPEARYSGGRSLATLPASFGFVGSEVDRIHDALSDKGRRYGKVALKHPLTIALLSTSGFIDDEDMGEVVYGRKAVQYTQGDRDAVRMVRKRNGYWRGNWSADNQPRGARVAAVLFGRNIRAWAVTEDLPQLWLNPWASVPLSHNDGFTTFATDESGAIQRTEGRLTAEDAFKLPREWPYFER
jgi:hypothetical protein